MLKEEDETEKEIAWYSRVAQRVRVNRICIEEISPSGLAFAFCKENPDLCFEVVYNAFSVLELLVEESIFFSKKNKPTEWDWLLGDMISALTAIENIHAYDEERSYFQLATDLLDNHQEELQHFKSRLTNLCDVSEKKLSLAIADIAYQEGLYRGIKH